MLDIKFEIDGRQVRAGDLRESLDEMFFKAIADQISSELANVRDPDTGEFPVVVIRGHDVSNLSFEVSGSEKVVALVKERLGISADEDDPMEERAPTKVFLSHASEDRELAKQIAEHLIANGIDTFFDRWEIGPGDSIRQKIDQGLEDCTHFVLLATPTSIAKPWVKTEIDGVYRRKIEGQCKLIPLRHKLDARQLPPSLGGLHAPVLNDFDSDMASLVSDLYNISKKPPMGKPPIAITQQKPDNKLGISAAAEAVVRLCMERTEHGDSFDPQLGAEAIEVHSNLSRDDIIDAIDELESLGVIKHHRHLGDDGVGIISPEATLFAKFDKYFNEWDPEQDALQIAIALQNDAISSGNSVDIAEQFDWLPRRLNPAMTYLAERNLIDAHQYMGTHPWRFGWIGKTPKTRRFVRDRS